jgi:hypothetical protein
MLSLTMLFWATVVSGFISFWWQSDKIKGLALSFVYQYCKDQNLQLLDQTMVLKGLWPYRDDQGSLRLRRRYGFEFTSTGQERYEGIISLAGMRMLSLDLDAHIIPDDIEH